MKEAVRLINQFLEAGTMPFEQIFSIVTNGYSDEEKELVLESFSFKS